MHLSSNWATKPLKFTFKAEQTQTKATLADSLQAVEFEPSLRVRSWSLDGKSAVCVLLNSGSADLEFSDEKQTHVSSGLVWLARRTPAVLKVTAGSSGSIIVVPPQKLDRAMPFGPIAGQIRDATRRTQVHSGLSVVEHARLFGSVQAIIGETKGPGFGSDEVIEAHVRLLVIFLWRLTRKGSIEANTSTSGNLAQRFLVEVDLRFRDQPSISDLAQTLGVTPGRLNRAVRRALDQSPKQVMHRKIIAAANQMLTESNLQIDQIAALLGFSDPSYFNRFFSERIGQSPARYRRMATHQQKEREEPSFAAWP